MTTQRPAALHELNMFVGEWEMQPERRRAADCARPDHVRLVA